MFTRREFMVGTGAVLANTALTRFASAATSLDLATVWPDGNFHTTNAKKFAAEVGKVTNGDIKITVQAGGSLGFKGPEQLRAVRDGLVPQGHQQSPREGGRPAGVKGAGAAARGARWAGPPRRYLEHPAGRRRADARHRVDPVPGRLRQRTENPAQVSAPRIRGDRGQEQPESPLHGAVADTVPASEDKDRQPRCAQGREDPRAGQERAGHVRGSR